MADLKETRVGLPNTCSECGADPGPSWFAANDDAALAGKGLCSSCAGQEQTFAARAQPNPDVEQLKRAVADVLTGGTPNERVLRPAPEAEAAARGERADLSAAHRQARDTLKAKR